MNIPDYISPIVGYRTWQWDAVGLKSLNSEPWFPGLALEASTARCRKEHAAPSRRLQLRGLRGQGPCPLA